MEEKKETICALKTFSILKGDCLGYPPTVSDNIPLIGRGVSLSSNLEVVVQFLTSLSMLMRCAVAIS